MTNDELDLVCDVPEQFVIEGAYIPVENNFGIKTDDTAGDRKVIDLSRLELNDLIESLYTVDPVTLDQAYNWVKNGTHPLDLDKESVDKEQQ